MRVGFWERRGFGAEVWAAGGERRNATGSVEEKGGVEAWGSAICNRPLALLKKKLKLKLKQSGFRVSVLFFMGGRCSSVPVTFLKCLCRVRSQYKRRITSKYYYFFFLCFVLIVHLGQLKTLSKRTRFVNAV